MNRRDFLQTTALGAAQVMIAPAAAKAPERPPSSSSPFRIKSFEWEEATVAQLQAAMKSGHETAASLVKKYLRRIEEIDRSGPKLNSIIELNPDASTIA